MTDQPRRAAPDKLGAYEILESIPTPDDLEHYLGVTVVDFVALTVLRLDPAKAAAATKEVARSARLASTVAGEHVVRTFRAEREGDLMFLVSQHLQGRWLADVLSAAGKLEPRAAVRVLLDVAAGLESIHSAAAVHGDVRPASVLLCEDGRARLAFLGLGAAVQFLVLPEKAREARAPYRPPEELRGRVPSPAGDLYSFGILLRELFAGAVPPGARDEELVRRGVPDGLVSFLHRLLSPTASARPTSARVVIDVLEDAVASISPAPRETIAEVVQSMSSPPPPPPRPRTAAPPPDTSLQVAIPVVAPPAGPPLAAAAASIARPPPPIPADAARIAMATPPPPPRTVSVARPPPSSPGGTPVRMPPPPPPPPPAKPPEASAPAQPPPGGAPRVHPPSRADRDLRTKETTKPAAPGREVAAGESVPASSAPSAATGDAGEIQVDVAPSADAAGSDGGAAPVAPEKTLAWAGAPATGEAKKVEAKEATARPTPAPVKAARPAAHDREPKTRLVRTPVTARRGGSRGLPAWLLVLLTLAAGAAIGAWFGLRERTAAERDGATRRERPQVDQAALPAEPAPAPSPAPAPVPSPSAPAPAPVPAPPPSRPPSGEHQSREPSASRRPAPPSKVARPTPARAAPTKTAAGTLQISCRRPCEVRIDGAPSAQSTSSGAHVAPGSHAVLVTDSQTRAARTLRVYVPSGVTVRRVVGF
ncbi:MAG: protein kinase [Deltaproteobacteria bacterium]|nr:protein kinase [Deltaproteobacteria bacterium]